MLEHVAPVRGTPKTRRFGMAREKSDLITHGRRLNDLGLALVESVHEAGGDDENARRVFKNKALCRQLGFLVMGKLAIFSIWRTVKLHTGLKTAEDFRIALRKKGCLDSEWANKLVSISELQAVNFNLLNQLDFGTAGEETELKLVKVSVAELGFKRGAKRVDIY